MFFFGVRDGIVHDRGYKDPYCRLLLIRIKLLVVEMMGPTTHTPTVAFWSSFGGLAIKNDDYEPT